MRLAAISSIIVCCAGVVVPAEAAPDGYEVAFEAARKDPFDDDKVDAFAKLLPEYDGKYLLDGDLLVTRPQLRGYLIEFASPAQPVEGELVVNTVDGAPDRWKPEMRTLTYSIEPGGFGDRLSKIEQSMKAAGDAWESACEACGVVFAPHTGGSPPTFVVRHVKGAPFIAAAFFPSWPPVDRVLQIDETYFTTPFDEVGILRHELGHVLGYRHEHIQGIPGCRMEGGTWMAITPYDGKSVMHYPCGGAGDRRLNLSQTDREGHSKNYSSEATGP